MSTSVINVGGQRVGVQVIPASHIAVPNVTSLYCEEGASVGPSLCGEVETLYHTHGQIALPTLVCSCLPPPLPPPATDSAVLLDGLTSSIPPDCGEEVTFCEASIRMGGDTSLAM